MSVVVTCLDAPHLAATVAVQLRAAVVRRQVDPDYVVQICLTGGRIANEVYRQVAADDDEAPTLDWNRVEFWWGDERFVPTASACRNAGQSLALLASSIPLAPSRVHPMPSSGSGMSDLRRAALLYESELGDTTFDICLLGLGEDGHVASLFPDHQSFDRGATTRVVGVTNAPKPPPERLSVTMPVINDSAEVWVIAAGAAKAPAAAQSIGGDQSLPAGVVTGRERTIWFLDQDAAQLLP
ncbi:MAG: 6-phosphogluconolactonase [Propionibacteriaceae bacterium]|nr:6-phosphogluconolactonase [Propionibacteriaceae bacterium]